jgi:NAD(P)-dependent dehydrogenase (short-subunit alcohol dehydrogenase family)
MSKPLAIVTGGGSGIGRYTALSLARQGIHVVVIGRRLEALRGTQAYAPRESITPLVADLSKPEQWALIGEQLPEGPIDFLVHSAGILGPFCNMGNVTYEQWRETITINAEAPLFLTQALLPKLSKGRVLFVSSGAADLPISHLGGYCGSKVLLRMIKRMLALDLGTDGLVFSALSPGAVDTHMQGNLRRQSNLDFPAVDYFKQLADEDQLILPSMVARYITWLLLGADRGLFASVDEWNFQAQEHFDLWSNSLLSSV